MGSVRPDQELDPGPLGLKALVITTTFNSGLEHYDTGLNQTNTYCFTSDSSH